MGPVYHGSTALLGTLLATPVVVGQANALFDPSNERDMASIRTDDAEVGVVEVEGRSGLEIRFGVESQYPTVLVVWKEGRCWSGWQ